MNKNIAFTLAELLITLGIIGVVAALTMPSLIVKHRKQVVVEKLKKTSSALLQAYNMAKLDYGDSNRERFTPLNGYGYLADGTVIYFFKSRETNDAITTWNCTYIAVCINEKACENLDSNVDASASNVANGKDVFGLSIDGKIPTWHFIYSTHEEIIERCKNNNSIEACSALIFESISTKLVKTIRLSFNKI